MSATALELAPDEDGVVTDVEGNTHASAINRIAAEGVTVGCEETRFCPDETMTGNQGATMLLRLYGTTDTAGAFFDDLGPILGENVERLARPRRSVAPANGCHVGVGRRVRVEQPVGPQHRERLPRRTPVPHPDLA